MNRSFEFWTGPLNRFQFVVYFKPAINFLMVMVMNFWGEGKKGKGSFYIAHYPVRWTAQSALHFLPSLADLFIRTPTRLLREEF